MEGRRWPPDAPREPEGALLGRVCIKEEAEWSEAEGAEHAECVGQLPGLVKQEPLEAPEHLTPAIDHMDHVHIKEEVAECEGEAELATPGGEGGPFAGHVVKLLPPGGRSAGHVVRLAPPGGVGARFAGRVVGGELVLEPVEPQERVKREEAAGGEGSPPPALGGEGEGAGEGEGGGGAPRLYAGLVVWAEPGPGPRAPSGAARDVAASARERERERERERRRRKREAGPYVCDSCGKTYKQRQILIRHIRHIHNPRGRKKPYACTMCHKAFARSDTLSKHRRTHAQLNQHSCDTCNEQFRGLEQLKLHRRSHTTANPYSCEICRKRCTRSDHLNIHMRKHTGGKPYSCDICNEGYSDLGSWKNHKLSHTVGNRTPVIYVEGSSRDPTNYGLTNEFMRE